MLFDDAFGIPTATPSLDSVEIDNQKFDRAQARLKLRRNLFQGLTLSHSLDCYSHISCGTCYEIGRHSRLLFGPA